MPENGGSLFAKPPQPSVEGLPLRFQLVRYEDPSGVSGTGVVADGVKWADGRVTMRWRGDHSSTVHWNSMADLEFIHGHDGATQVVYADTEE